MPKPKHQHYVNAFRALADMLAHQAATVRITKSGKDCYLHCSSLIEKTLRELHGKLNK